MINSNAKSSIGDDQRPFARLHDTRNEPFGNLDNYELHDFGHNARNIQVQNNIEVEWQEAR